MRRRPFSLLSCAAAARQAPHVSRRAATTGDHHSYQPGRLATVLRSLFLALTPQSLKKKIAVSMQSGMERAEAMEKEQQWVHRHGSPLQVMGLPEHAALAEVKARYRNLVLEAHPDTSTHPTGENEYAILQAAYKICTDPASLWHQNGSAPALQRELLRASKSRIAKVDRVSCFALFCYAVMIIAGIFFSVVVVANALEAALRFFDPEFYHFMIQQEEEEKRKRMAGEVVDTDPKRLAPTALRRLLFPGQYIHEKE